MRRHRSAVVVTAVAQRSKSGVGGEDNDVAWRWLCGPRTAAEIGEAAVAQFVAELMAERTSRSGGSGAGGAGGSAGASDGPCRDGERGG